MKGCLGAEHPAWNGGGSSDRDLIKSTPEYIEWRSQVYKRDNYTCQKCLRRGAVLNAHHIESFSDNPGLRTEVSNGITLCKDCHNDFHHQYGYGGNTHEQFSKFLDAR